MSKKPTQLYIFGKKPIEDMLLTDPENVKTLYVRNSVNEADVEAVRAYTSKHKIPMVKVNQPDLERKVGDVNDQGFVAEIREYKHATLDEWFDQINLDENPLLFVLDELEDPHNVGAVIRTAAASGAAGVMLSKHRQAPLSSTVYKTSAGTMSKIPIIVVSNTNDGLRKLKEKKFWVAGLSSDAGKTVWDEAYDTPMAFVIGNEGKGVREKTKETCDYLLSIPMERDVESLNASVSAAVVAYEWKRKNQR